jgi:hypothetical protein
MKQQKSNNVICAGQFSDIEAGTFCGGEIEPGTFHGGEIEPGTFHGGEIEPGTFHCRESEPGTFHDACQAQDVASKAGDEEPKKVVKESGSDAGSSEKDETSFGNEEGQS